VAEIEESVLPIDSDWGTTLEADYDDLNFVEVERTGRIWDFDNEEVAGAIEHIRSTGNLYTLDIPYKGYVRSYGSTNLREDIATFRETVISDPVFFQKI